MRIRIWGCGMLVTALLASAAQAQTDWPNFSHDASGTRYSPLKQISAKNVARLKLAWTFDPTAPVTETPGGYGGRPAGQRTPAAAAAAPDASGAAPSPGQAQAAPARPRV